MEVFLLIFLPIILFLLAAAAIVWLLVRTVFRLIPRTRSYSGRLASLTIVGVPLLWICSCLFHDERTGEEIYSAVFRGPKPDCVKIINFKDAHVPFIDNEIVLWFRTCPHEMSRVLKLEEYDGGIESTKFSATPMMIDSSFHFSSMGDSV